MKPTIRTDHYQNISKPIRRASDHYKGLRILAAGGLHEFIFRQLSERLAKNAGILELGGGSGALTLRLADAAIYLSKSIELISLSNEATGPRKLFKAFSAFTFTPLAS